MCTVWHRFALLVVYSFRNEVLIFIVVGIYWRKKNLTDKVDQSIGSFDTGLPNLFKSVGKNSEIVHVVNSIRYTYIVYITYEL